MYRVYDGPRILEFEGEEIGFSTSERPGAGRWIEFTLYRTAGEGRYVLSRVGVSNVYHVPGCHIAERGNIEPSPWRDLPEDAVPCWRVKGAVDPCRPDPEEFPLVSIEPDKTWARDYGDPAGVLRALMKPDKNGGELYLTAVARRVLEDAARRDPAIAGAFQVQTIA